MYITSRSIVLHLTFMRNFILHLGSIFIKLFKNAEREFSAIYSRDESDVNALTFSNICLFSCRLRGIIGSFKVSETYDTPLILAKSLQGEKYF